MKSRHLFAAMAVLVAGTFASAALVPHAPLTPAPPAGGSTATPGPTTSTTPSAPPAAYDVQPLIESTADYVGVSMAGVPQDMSRVDAFVRRAGNKPNMITVFESFDDDFAASEVRKIFQYGALPIVRWEPYRHTLTGIAAGHYDDYLTDFATDVRRVNVPIALTVAHEMNGYWYPWGTRQSTAKGFVAAWRHIHTLFATAGATNVIWTWTVNVVNYLRDVPLRRYWPGTDYVDWVGIDGYFTRDGDQSFTTLFGPTIKQVRALTDKPILIVETGAVAGSLRARVVQDLFQAIRRERGIIGFVYFNTRGSQDWVIDQDPKALAVFRSQADRVRLSVPTQ